MNNTIIPLKKDMGNHYMTFTSLVSVLRGLLSSTILSNQFFNLKFEIYPSSALTYH